MQTIAGISRGVGLGLILWLLAPLSSLAVVGSATQPSPPAAPTDTGVPVERFEFSYGLEHHALPPLEELKKVTVHATRDGNVFRATTAKGAENLTLSAIPEGSRFDGNALRGIAQDVVRWYNARGIYGVWVTYPDLETSNSGVIDNRPPDDHAAHMIIWASQIAEVRTLARGKRFKPQSSVNNRKHRAILKHSPLKAGDLFRQDILDNYLRGLSLHPGRLVEASIASAGEPGKVVLDYLVNESKAWQVFGQVTNFGTESTGVWRGRVGYQDNQLTNHDDILNVDVISTPDFKTYGSFLSYRIPVFRPAKLLARVYGSYGDFLASDATIDTLRFAGKNWLEGVEFSNRLALPWDWQLVSATGANYAHYAIQSRIVNTPLVGGFSNFLIPFFSGTLSRDSNWWSLSGSLRYDRTVGNFANLSTTNGIPSLGRLAADSEWTSLRGTLNGTIYLEPIFGGIDRAHHLANELSLRVRGRYLLKGRRLIPHEEEPIGGAASVRGYPESILSADEFATATVEYAFHVARLIKPGEPGKFIRWPFQWRPARAKQNPDWDLIGRAFYDYGYRVVNPVPATAGGPTPGGEVALADKSLAIAGVGCGLELQLKQNFSVRCDVGEALTQLKDPSRSENQVVVPAGEIHYYFSSSISW